MNTAGQRQNTRDFDMLLGEYYVLKQKLDSKIQALLIISRDLEQCRNERDHYKAMIEQLKPDAATASQIGTDLKNWALSNLLLDSRRIKGQADYLIAHHLCELKEKETVLQAEVRDLKQKLQEADGDIKLLRDQNARFRMGASDESAPTRVLPSYERKNLVEQLESLKVKYMLLEKDLQAILDEKEELITERDAYRNKVERLNHELNIALKGDEKRIIDIDAILMENRYLQERLKQTQEEKSLYLQTLSKYKNILEKRRNKSALKLGGSGIGNVIITHKQVEQMLQNTNLSQLPATQATVADLRSLALALFESLNDKNVALAHQKKANKILGHRLAELEKKISSLEISKCWEINDEGTSNINQLNQDSSLKDHDPSTRNELIENCHAPSFNVFPKPFLDDYGPNTVSKTEVDEKHQSFSDFFCQEVQSADDSIKECGSEESIMQNSTTQQNVTDIKSIMCAADMTSSKELQHTFHNTTGITLAGSSAESSSGTIMEVNETEVMSPELQKLIDDAMDDLNSKYCPSLLEEQQNT